MQPAVSAPPRVVRKERAVEGLCDDLFSYLFSFPFERVVAVQRPTIHRILP